MHRDIDDSGLWPDTFDLPKLIRQSFGERCASEGDSREHKLARCGIMLKNFMRDPPQRAGDRFFIQD
jgi:hypothetical protein